MHPLRLAYPTLVLIALVAFFMLWNEVGGSAHLDLMPWHLKLALVGAAALAFIKATEAAVSGEQAWNGRTLRWAGILVSVLVACGLATYYYHLYEEDAVDEEESVTEVRPALGPARRAMSPIEGTVLLAQDTESNHIRACGQLLPHLRPENELEVPRSSMGGRTPPQPAYHLL